MVHIYIRPPLGKEKHGLFRGMASHEGYPKYNYTEIVRLKYGFIRRVASGDGGHI